jgi:hypothetical protein
MNSLASPRANLNSGTLPPGEAMTFFTTGEHQNEAK